jgi:hypothetical protein
MSKIHRKRRVAALLAISIVPLYFLITQLSMPRPDPVQSPVVAQSGEPTARTELEKLTIRTETTKSGYKRDEFGSGWAGWDKCDTRQKILNRDLYDITLDSDNCTVLTGVLADPYTGETINFTRGTSTSSAVQIDHVVALSNAWSSGAADWDKPSRVKLANDDLELIAVDGPANMQKGAADASVWLPPSKAFRCQYVARQIAVKIKYALSITAPEHDAMTTILSTCPEQRLPSP